MDLSKNGSTLPENSDASRILIVDDNANTITYISDLLKDNGYEPLTCDNGQKAIEMIRKEKIDCALVDIVMPDTNGITLTSQMKSIADPLDFFPIILVSALTAQEDKIAGLAYADDYITKPFSGDELLARVKALLRIRRLHRELTQSKDRYKSLYENAPYMYLSIDSQNNVIDCNQLVCKIIKSTKNDIVGKNILSFVKDEEKAVLDHFLVSLASVEPSVGQHVFSLVFGAMPESLLVDMKAVYMGEKKTGVSIVIAMEDVTKRMRLEEEQKIARRQLYRSANLASLGTLASGVAHEINNPMTAILGFSSALLDRIKTDDKIDSAELQQYLQIINNEAIRCRDIVEKLSKFAREGEFSTSSISLPDCINNAIRAIGSKITHAGITVKNTLADDIRVKADAGKLEQVFINILSNCVDFCGEKTVVTIALDATGIPRANCVALAIRDNGPGISAEILPKVFDPFFTTKEVGKGTGMGLAICHKIMEESNGSIDITSGPGQGTTVFLEIPGEIVGTETGEK